MCPPQHVVFVFYVVRPAEDREDHPMPGALQAHQQLSACARTPTAHSYIDDFTEQDDWNPCFVTVHQRSSHCAQAGHSLAPQSMVGIPLDDVGKRNPPPGWNGAHESGIRVAEERPDN